LPTRKPRRNYGLIGKRLEINEIAQSLTGPGFASIPSDKTLYTGLMYGVYDCRLILRIKERKQSPPDNGRTEASMTPKEILEEIVEGYARECTECDGIGKVGNVLDRVCEHCFGEGVEVRDITGLLADIKLALEKEK